MYCIESDIDKDILQFSVWFQTLKYNKVIGLPEPTLYSGDPPSIPERFDRDFEVFHSDLDLLGLDV